MTDVKKTSTRRAFFLKGGAVLGAGVAATAGAAGLASRSATEVGPGRAARGAADTDAVTAGAAGSAEDREAIRRLHLAFVARLEHQGADALTGVPRLETQSGSADSLTGMPRFETQSGSADALTGMPRLETRGGSADALASIPRLHTHSRSATSNASQLAGEGVEAPTNLFGQESNLQLGAYRQTTSQQHDEMTFSDDGLQATATFHCEVELCSPLQADCTAAQMARMQGLMASRRWERGRFEASYMKARGQWQMTAVRYIRA